MAVIPCASISVEHSFTDVMSNQIKGCHYQREIPASQNSSGDRIFFEQKKKYDRNEYRDNWRQQQYHLLST